MAGAIDVSGQSFQLLQSGNTLTFVFSPASYYSQASQLELSPYPTQIDFSFASSEPTVSGQFSAELQSLDGATELPFPTSIPWQAGYAYLSQYSGPVAVLNGSVALSPPTSQAIFADTYAEIVLTYIGSPVTAGLQGYTLPSAMFVSLNGSQLSVGAPVYSTYFDPPGAPDSTPEPGSLWLLGGGLAAGVIGWARRRFRSADAIGATVTLPTSCAAR